MELAADLRNELAQRRHLAKACANGDDLCFFLEITAIGTSFIFDDRWFLLVLANPNMTLAYFNYIIGNPNIVCSPTSNLSCIVYGSRNLIKYWILRGWPLSLGLMFYCCVTKKNNKMLDFILNQVSGDQHIKELEHWRLFMLSHQVELPLQEFLQFSTLVHDWRVYNWLASIKT